MTRRAVSTAVIVGIVGVIVVAAGAGYVLFAGQSGQKTSSSTSSVSASSSQTVTQKVDTATAEANLNTFVGALNSRNIDGMIAFYRPTAVVNWTANANALAAAGQTGVYRSTSNIRLLYQTTISNAKVITVSVSNLKGSANSTAATLTFSLAMTGNSSLLGNFNGTIQASQVWLAVGGNLQIAKENWYFQTFNTQNQIEATVFPQWGLALQGRSPDLASEHVIEWRAAPFLAIALYSLLAAVAVFVIVVKRRKQGE